MCIARHSTAQERRTKTRTRVRRGRKAYVNIRRKAVGIGAKAEFFRSYQIDASKKQPTHVELQLHRVGCLCL